LTRDWHLEVGLAERGNTKGLDRILTLADGVFAIAITILVLDLRVPPGLIGRELPTHIADLMPEFISYGISFAVIAIYWQAQREVFEDIESTDAALTWMTFLFLMAIAFLPFPTLLLGEYRDQQISVIFYAADAAVASLLLVGISWYASAERSETIRQNSGKYRPHRPQELAGRRKSRKTTFLRTLDSRAVLVWER
jgi:uncharacterized membrane protein